MDTESRIAVVGIACRLPGGVDSPESLWSLLAEGKDGWTEVPKDRWNWKSFYHKDPDAKEATNFTHAYFLKEDVSAFDARFFGISPSEAPSVDPQQRLLMEVTYEAVENAGLPLDSLRGSNTSVHVAISERDYDRMGYKDLSRMHRLHLVGSGDAVLANRISYLLDLRGSSNTLDTGCSGGLVAIYQACRSLRADDSEIALAGAVQMYLSPDQSIAMSALTNKNGRCYTFDDRGEGYGRGEGVAVLVLKRLDRALANGDRIHAVIVETGSNQDGKTSGMLLPNPDAQAALSQSVYKRAGLDPLETLYVETHGTGTVAGDNAEVASISRVFGRQAGRKSNLIIGSVKANIGHLEAASGIAGMIKAIMVLKNDKIPKQLNYINPKPNLKLDERGITIPLELTPLTPEGHIGPRRVSVNGFGYGGTNVHAILEAFNPKSVTNGHSSHVNGTSNGIVNRDGGDSYVEERVIALSANSESSLDRMISNLRQWLVTEQSQATSFADLAYTLTVRRSKLSWRCSAVASTLQDLERALGDSKTRPVKAAKEVGTAFIFTGQGAQWFAMGRELLTGSKVFASSVERCNQAIKALGCNWDLVEELSRDKDTSRIGEARFSQPSTTAVQIALVDLLERYGVRPQAVCGHSSGEIAAAYAAGALSLDAAMATSYHRGICSSEAKTLNSTAGSMLAVGEGEEAIQKRIQALSKSNGKLTVACVNSPESTTISGDLDAILELQTVLEEKSVFNRKLQVDSAYHSHHMLAVSQTYLSSLENLKHESPRKDVAFFSSVTGARKESDFGPSYWVSNLVSQVKFSVALQLVAEHLSTITPASNILVEVGPHSALKGPLRQTLSNYKVPGTGASFSYTYLPCLVRNESAVSTILALAGNAFEAGHSVILNDTMGMHRSESTSRRQVIENLPSYPWDHSSTYWHESRLSKGHRLREFPPHDLLGLLDVACSTHEPRWRHHISLETLPWLRDHVIDGFVIFPGAGYLAMVTEAMKQLFKIRKTPGQFGAVRFRDVTFAKPVIIHDDPVKGSQEVELQLAISPSRQHTGSAWEYFRILSWDSQNDSWIDNCAGFVSSEADAPETQSQSDSKVRGASTDGLGHLTEATAAEMLRDIQANASIQVDAKAIYNELSASGNAYGPSFQGMKDIHVGKHRGLARIEVGDIESKMPGQHIQPHLFHPSTFDAMLQLVTVVFRREVTVAPIMPVNVGEMTMSAEMDSTPGAEILVAIRLVAKSRVTGSGDWCAYQKQSDGTFRPVATGLGMRLQVIGKLDSVNSSEQKTSYRLAWEPDVDHISQDDFMAHISKLGMLENGVDLSGKPSMDDQLVLYERMATLYNRRALNRMQEEGIAEACSPHLNKLRDWMLRNDESEASKFLETISPEDEENLVAHGKAAGIVGLILSRIGPYYYDILVGKADPLELLVEDDLLGQLYSEYVLFKKHYAQMTEYFPSLVHKNPNMKILEIGAGTGGATLPLLQKIERDNRLLLDKYTYTDISSGFFETARRKFGKWTSQMEFKTLDISSDPFTQGFAAQSFDIIVAANVLHATPLVDVTLRNVRRLLKPGGRLILMELTSVSAAHTGIVGPLEGWWLTEDGRKDGPLLHVLEWDKLLKRTGFTGTDLVIPAHTGQRRDISSVMITRAVSHESHVAASPGKKTANVYLGNSNNSQSALGDAIRVSLGNQGVDCSRQAWDMRAPGDANKLVVVIDSPESPLLMEPTQETFGHVKQLLLQEKNILWVSFPQSTPSSHTLAVQNMVNGMARVVRHEDPSLRLVTVNIQDQIQLPSSAEIDAIVQTLTDVALSSFWPSSEASRSAEVEYVISGGKLIIPRVIPDDNFAKFLDSRDPSSEPSSASPSLVECKYLNNDRSLMLDVRVPGLLNTIRFVDNDKMSEPLSPHEIEVQVHAHGINFKDVLIAMGQMTPGTIMTGEAAGIVTAVGSEAQPSWKPGDRVVGLFVAPYGNRVRVDSNAAVHIPDNISFTDTASMSLVFYTAWHCLSEVHRLTESDKILIHAASGGVGQATIQIAQHYGAEVYATVGSLAKKKLIQDQYNIPESHIFSSRTGEFKKHIMNATQGQGVDVVLNSLSGQLLSDSWDCVAQFGTFIEIGKTDIQRRNYLNMANFDKQVTFAAVDVGHLYQKRPSHAARLLREVLSMRSSGEMGLVHPVTTYPMGQIGEAFSLIAARKHTGKLVLVADEQTTVQATKAKALPLRLQCEGTYVVSGGVGDIGTKICHFLAEKGAGHIVALTRRELDAQQRAPMEEAVKNLGGTLHIVKCDIGDEKAVQAAAEKISGLPPVRGVIQSALVLDDHPMDYMEFDHWMTAVRPKVHGTMNMDRIFCSPETTEFFVMLSSVTSMIGLASQSNYAAGNGFQDALARTSKQFWTDDKSITNYTTINVGAVEGSDQIARALQAGTNITVSVTFDDVLTTLEYAMGPQAKLDQAAQLVMTFDRDDTEAALGPRTFDDHIFDHVLSKKRQQEISSNNNATTTNKPSAATAAEQAESISQAESIVNQALVDKFAAFLGDDVADDQPIASLGVDSLVSIELKNWVRHTFQTPLQTVELSGAPSIKSLAKLVVSRMNLKCNAMKKGDVGVDDKQDAPADGQGQQPAPTGDTSSHGYDCCKRSKELPVQPLPDLDDALDFWLEANEHFHSPEQLETIHEDIKTMRAPGSPARQVLQDMFAAHADDKSNGWLDEILTDARFLCQRDPLAPYHSIMASLRESKNPHSQAERAAIITLSSLSFKRSLEAGEVEPLEVAGKPECMWRMRWLFNSVRVPKLGCDKMMHYGEEQKTSPDYIAVLRKGHLFKVVLQDENQGQDISFGLLKATFEAIVAHVQDDGIWPGILTTDKRDSWAMMREKLVSVNPANSDYLHVIDAAMFVLCLDDGSPETPQQRAQQGYIGDGSNRWFDKVLQFYVSANGRSGLIMEHGSLDGTTSARLLETIGNAIEGSNAPQDHQIGLIVTSSQLNEIVLETTPEINNHINLLRGRFLEYTSPKTITYVLERLDEFGTDFLMRHKVPVKGLIDLTFQLALRLFFGRSLPSWEPSSAAHFHKGRSDGVQRATPAVAAFCEAVSTIYADQDHHDKVDQLETLLSIATKQMNAAMRDMLNGRSYLRVMELLSWKWPSSDKGPIPKPHFLSEHIFFGRPFPPVFAQTNAIEGDMLVEDFVHVMPSPEGLWAILLPDKEEIRVSLTAGSPEQTAAFIGQLHRAARIMRGIVQTKSG